MHKSYLHIKLYLLIICKEVISCLGVRSIDKAQNLIILQPREMCSSSDTSEMMSMDCLQLKRCLCRLTFALTEFCGLWKNLIGKATYRSVSAKLLINFGSTVLGQLLTPRTLPPFVRSVECNWCHASLCQRSSL